MLEYPESAFVREDITVTDYQGVGVYVDDDGALCPTVVDVVDRIDFSEEPGRLYEPLMPTDGVNRTTDRPDLIRWYAARVGELAHDYIADYVDLTYEAEADDICDRIHDAVGIDADSGEVVEALDEYRHEEYVADDTVTQAQRDAKTLKSVWMDWADDHNVDWLQDTIRAEWRTIYKVEVDWDTRVGIRPDLIVWLDGDVTAVSLKTGYRITMAHRMQATITAKFEGAIDRVMIVRLDRDTETYEIEEPDGNEDWPTALLDVRFREEARKLFRALN
ncbi:hypothetical protein [Natrinema pallidum]|uniref:Uncharacterized protein n=1 Tax=Natrinema pallidum TaxID=69527 RepID=A0A4P9TCS6_9EURY|nr:hypothetical protein [Natrinema pallidum]QCW01865.1 hypothetical protein FGF80_00805 [Natrinema pallidum]